MRKQLLYSRWVKQQIWPTIIWPTIIWPTTTYTSEPITLRALSTTMTKYNRIEQILSVLQQMVIRRA